MTKNIVSGGKFKGISRIVLRDIILFVRECVCVLVCVCVSVCVCVYHVRSQFASSELNFMRSVSSRIHTTLICVLFR